MTDTQSIHERLRNWSAALRDLDGEASDHGAMTVIRLEQCEKIDAAVAALAKLEEEKAELARENEQIRTLMNVYNLGGWTDSLRALTDQAKRIDDLQSRLAEYEKQPVVLYQRPADIGQWPIASLVRLSDEQVALIARPTTEGKEG